MNVCFDVGFVVVFVGVLRPTTIKDHIRGEHQLTTVHIHGDLNGAYWEIVQLKPGFLYVLMFALVLH